MIDRHDAEGFGSCSNEGECEAVCPKEIPITNIARMNRDYIRATLLRGGDRDRGGRPDADDGDGVRERPPGRAAAGDELR